MRRAKPVLDRRYKSSTRKGLATRCGIDHLTGENYEHRREWIVTKLKSLSQIFSIDICAYAVMSNHYHVILHVDANVAATWNQAEMNKVNEIVAEWRTRLSDISWFIRVLNESIARQANREDNCTGRFWEGRFKSQALLTSDVLINFRVVWGPLMPATEKRQGMDLELNTLVVILVAAISSHLLSMLPYLATILVLVLFSRDPIRIRVNAPGSLG